MYASRSIGLVVACGLTFLLAVSRFVQSQDVFHDRVACASFHASQYGLIMISGILLGLVLGPSLNFGLGTLLHYVRVTPLDEEAKRRILLKFAWGALVISMLPSIFWSVSSLNMFVDQHTGLVAEVDFIDLLMGIVSGTSWWIILKHRSWVGVVASLAMIFMVIGSMLSSHGWC